MPILPAAIRAILIVALQLLYCYTVCAQASPAADSRPPSGNSEIRQWYNEQVAGIEAEDKKWQQQGLSCEQRARRAYEIRHAARLKARQFMQDRDEVALLQARDKAKYGHPDGPTFDYLVEQNRSKGLRGDDIYLAIIGSATTTNADVNKAFARPQPSAPPQSSAP